MSALKRMPDAPAPLHRLLRRWRAARELVRLTALDDAALKDMGLSRADFPALRVGGFGEDTTRRQR